MNKIQLVDLVMSYDNNLHIPKDVVDAGNCLYIALVLSDTIPCNDTKILRSNLKVRTRSLLKGLDFSDECSLRNYFADQEFDSRGSIDNYVNYDMVKDGNWRSTFEMVCDSIIYGVLIISIANMKGIFMISDTLQSIYAYQIPNDIIRSSDRNVFFILPSVQRTHQTVFSGLLSQLLRLSTWNLSFYSLTMSQLIKFNFHVTVLTII